VPRVTSGSSPARGGGAAHRARGHATLLTDPRSPHVGGESMGPGMIDPGDAVRAGFRDHGIGRPDRQP